MVCSVVNITITMHVMGYLATFPATFFVSKMSSYGVDLLEDHHAVMQAATKGK